MKKVIYLATAAALLVSTAPAYANGTGNDGRVHIGVIGEKLKVREVRALLDDHEAGAKAHVSLWKNGEEVRIVRNWKYTEAKETGGYKYEYASWKLHNRSFPNHSQLCVEFAGHEERACSTIHR
ncbi:hypothetical protein [Streptomyces mirabilis]|uniref:hypothetical protein n=1 Tax=Streptomyces mirabilis TaxID=68239 RepID=UPI0036A477A3